MRSVATAANDVFAANRARASITLGVGARGNVTRCVSLHEAGGLRARFPNCDVGEFEAVILNTAGGIAGGDQLTVAIAVDDGGRLTVTTAAAEKAYRSIGPPATIDVRLTIGAGGLLRWLPQELILFNRARIRRSIDIDLAEDATLVLAESVLFGRSAMGETIAVGAFFDRWRVRRGGRLVYAETVRLEGLIAEKLARPAVADGGQAIATVLLIPSDDSAVAAARALSEDFRGEVGLSSWNGITVVRICAKEGSHLRHDLVSILARCGRGPLPRLWLN
ncbi:MAG: urease accessory protein UreD [Bradyrhizobiaceae bacterium]|nr:urease accessory protein UreD [Bradyrhizobiaceae bacterium]